MIAREAYLTSQHRPVDCGETDATVYQFERAQSDGRTAYILIGWHGKSNKPDFHLRFETAERRDAYVANYLNGRRETAAWKATQRRAQLEPHSLKAGDILDSHWGYDQTNVDFYEVTNVISPRMVEIRPIAQTQTPTLYLQGTCVPNPGQFLGPAMRKRASKDNHITLTSYSSASPWHGRPCSWSAYA